MLRAIRSTGRGGEASVARSTMCSPTDRAATHFAYLELQNNRPFSNGKSSFFGGISTLSLHFQSKIPKHWHLCCNLQYVVVLSVTGVVGPLPRIAGAAGHNQVRIVWIISDGGSWGAHAHAVCVAVDIVPSGGTVWLASRPACVDRIALLIRPCEGALEVPIVGTNPVVIISHEQCGQECILLLCNASPDANRQQAGVSATSTGRSPVNFRWIQGFRSRTWSLMHASSPPSASQAFSCNLPQRHTDTAVKPKG